MNDIQINEIIESVKYGLNENIILYCLDGIQNINNCIYACPLSLVAYKYYKNKNAVLQWNKGYLFAEKVMLSYRMGMSILEITDFAQINAFLFGFDGFPQVQWIKNNYSLVFNFGKQLRNKYKPISL